MRGNLGIGFDAGFEVSSQRQLSIGSSLSEHAIGRHTLG